MKKTRVLFVVIQLDAGGSERVVLDLARSLDSNEFDVFVVSLKGGVLEEAFRQVCVDLFIINKKNGFDFSLMLQLARIVRKHQIDVVNPHHYMPCFYSFLGAKVLNRRRLIYVEHSVPEVEEVATSVHGKVFYWLMYGIDAVVGVSGEITKRFIERYPQHEKKFLPVINGIEINRFQSVDSRDLVRGKWEVEPAHFVVGVIANFRRVKNHSCLLRAVARIHEDHPQLRLVFVGAGFSTDPENSETEVCKQIQELRLQDIVILAGYLENVPEVLSALDAFCLPSFSEGLPVSLLEAMAAHVPVIGSQVRGISEVIQSRQNGLLFPANDDEALADILVEIIESPTLRTSLIDNAFRYVVDHHDNKSWVQKYAKLFRSF